MGAGGRAGVEVEGGPQLRRAFKRLGANAADMTELHGDIGELVADRAGDLVPRDTGRLADSIGSRRTRTSAAVTAGRGLPYAGPIHFGWRARNIEPQPFLYDALDDRRGEILERYRDGVATLVRRFDIDAPD